jgi:hypothetical protein
VQPKSYRPLQVADVGFNRTAPRDLPVPPQQDFILSGKMRPRVDAWQIMPKRSLGCSWSPHQRKSSLPTRSLPRDSPGVLSSWQACNVGESIRGKSGRSSTFSEDDRQVMSIKADERSEMSLKHAQMYH